MRDTAPSADRPPALDLPPGCEIGRTSAVRSVLEPESQWPREILEEPILVRRTGGSTLALIADPAAVQRVLTGSEEEFPKWEIYERFLGRGIGPQSVSVASGRQWRRLRASLSPLFRAQVVDAEIPAFRAAADEVMTRWASSAHEEVDIAEDMAGLTLSVIWRVLRGDPAETPVAGHILPAVRELGAAQRAGDFRGVAEQLTGLAHRAAASPPGARFHPESPFCPIMGVEGESALSRAEQFDNLRALFGAGHDSTGLTLAWALWLVARSPRYQDRACEEIHAVAGSDPIRQDHLARLEFCAAVLSEAQRLYPSCVTSVRRTVESVELAGTVLPAGSILVLAFYAMHRHRRLWSFPDEFRPERFLPGSGEPVTPFAFLPFSAGRHVCLASRFGWHEALVVFASILRRWRVEADRSAAMKPRVTISARPGGPLRVRLSPR
ncbi:cytochrome P450 [Marinicauda algicola]|uniref:Cytochrome P450 n=1 Tax=Marinicauda algicola TaxID=2029849 RepID=A0A4S2H0C3_9PROT|nr:cytochrome P450 [Marinicauda algicola]TGY88990.1 cytochrome P450 [Marinicauda algicola]